MTNMYRLSSDEVFMRLVVVVGQGRHEVYQVDLGILMCVEHGKKLIMPYGCTIHEGRGDHEVINNHSFV